MAKKTASANQPDGTYMVSIVLRYARTEQRLGPPVNYIRVVKAAGALVRQHTGEHPPIKLTVGRRTITSQGDFDALMSQVGDNDCVEIHVRIDRDNPKAHHFDHLFEDEETVSLTNSDDLDDDRGTLPSSLNHSSSLLDAFSGPVQFSAPFVEANADEVAPLTSSAARRQQRAFGTKSGPGHLPSLESSYPIAHGKSSAGYEPILPGEDNGDRSEFSSTVQVILSDPQCVQALSSLLTSPALKPVLTEITESLVKTFVSHAPLLLNEFAVAVRTAPRLAEILPEKAMASVAELIAESAMKERIGVILATNASTATSSQAASASATTNRQAQKNGEQQHEYSKLKESATTGTAKSRALNMEDDSTSEQWKYRPLSTMDKNKSKADNKRERDLHLLDPDDGFRDMKISTGFQDFDDLRTTAAAPPPAYHALGIPATTTTTTTTSAPSKRSVHELDSRMSRPIVSSAPIATTPSLIGEAIGKTTRRDTPIATRSPIATSSRMAGDVERFTQRPRSSNASSSNVASAAMYKAKLFMDSSPTSVLVERVGIMHTVRWVIQNTGRTAWPRHVILQKSSGDLLFTPTRISSTSVASGESVQVEVKFKVGDYLSSGEIHAVFQLFDEDTKQFFGDEFKLNVIVVSLMRNTRQFVEPSAPPLDLYQNYAQPTIFDPRGQQEQQQQPGNLVEEGMLFEQAVKLAEEFNLEAGIVLDVLRQNPHDMGECRTQLMIMSGRYQ